MQRMQLRSKLNQFGVGVTLIWEVCMCAYRIFSSREIKSEIVLLQLLAMHLVRYHSTASHRIDVIGSEPLAMISGQKKV
jgi:hypothetical protein